MNERKWQVLCCVLIVLFMVMFLYESKMYDDLLEVNGEQSDLIEEMSQNNSEIVEKWETSYEDLQSKYGRALAENDHLKQQIEDMNRVALPEYSFTPEEIELLCKCVQCEAGETSKASQRYVCQVVLNRVVSGYFPDSVTEVIYQKIDGVPQFSVTTNGSIDSCEVSEFTYHNVYYVLMFGTDMPEDVLFFYSTKVDKNWVNSRKTWKTVDGTVFAY